MARSVDLHQGPRPGSPARGSSGGAAGTDNRMPELRDVLQAPSRLQGKVERTPLVASPSLSKKLGGPVYLKLENLQTTGSFKLRGATNAVAALPPGTNGVVTVSTGNHGRALAHACGERGLPATVCVSELVPGNKVEAIRELGARVHVGGRSQDEAALEAQRLVREEGLVLLPPFDHPDVIAGQATLGLEIVEQLHEARALQEDTRLRVLVPLSGGGLLAGVALAVKGLEPTAQILGVSSERCCAMHRSLEAGRPVEVPELESLADSLGGGIGVENRYTFRLVRELIDDSLVVGEEHIARGIVHAYRAERQVLEGAAAAPLGAVLCGAVPPAAGSVTVLVVSGANIDMQAHLELLNRAQQAAVGSA